MIYKATRYPTSLIMRIEQETGGDNFSKWVREAAVMRLESGRGLTPKYAAALSQIHKELNAIGRNLNQISRKANSGASVTVDQVTLLELMRIIATARDDIVEVRALLSG